MVDIQEYINREAPDIEARKLGLIDTAKALAEKGYTLPDFQLAGLTPEQLQAIQLQGQGIGTYAPFLADKEQALTAGLGTIGTGLGTTGQAISQLGAITGAPTQALFSVLGAGAATVLYRLYRWKSCWWKWI